MQLKHGEIAARLNIQPAGRVLKLWAPFTTTTTARQVGRLEQNPAQESARHDGAAAKGREIFPRLNLGGPGIRADLHRYFFPG